MTEPIELLQERLKEIKQVKLSLKNKNLPKKDMKELELIYNKYYVCIKIIKKALKDQFFIKGEKYEISTAMFMDQEKEIKLLRNQLEK